MCTKLQQIQSKRVNSFTEEHMYYFQFTIHVGLDECEWLEDIEREDSSLATFMSCVEECISERECRKFEEGLNNKVKLAITQYGSTVYIGIAMGGPAL